MPQMKPMNWMFLYLSLNLIVLMMNIINYYFNNMLNFNNNNEKMVNLKKNINWKW